MRKCAFYFKKLCASEELNSRNINKNYVSIECAAKYIWGWKCIQTIIQHEQPIKWIWTVNVRWHEKKAGIVWNDNGYNWI